MPLFFTVISSRTHWQPYQGARSIFLLGPSLRCSERNKGDGASGKDDFSLPAPPPPLQVKERLLASEKTSTPTRAVPLDEEAQLDKTLGEMERSIHETERRLKEMVDQQRVKGKKDKLV